ncbi:hydroxypyruvate isomerase [Sphingomonas vulcanisoli]|uniref:Hydroxypyruvate isomerase n=1 Tax=Sphingomonas vulcanisoli TaxID=1658060 RepID=A0ABX0TYP7_9SPHN|nr:sugar phosphate isomerase/epimerase family protein [Sphingomonas vulcanisoli]NIJ08756.1 hydroxypyruvate isomerase [Sphingomonas vulcanisoli]
MGGRFKLRYASHLGIRGTHEPLFAATVGSLDPIDHIAFAAEQGFAGVEDNFFKTRDPSEQSRMGDAFARFGLELGCVLSSVVPNTAWIRDDAEACAAVDAEIACSIEAVKRAGGRYIVVAPPRDLRAPVSYQMAALIKHMRRLAPLAEREGMILCIEMTSEPRLPGQLLHHIADANTIALAVDSPAVKLLLDVFHVQMMDGNILYNLSQVWDNVAIAQIADVPNRTEIGIGEVNWRTVLRHFSDQRFPGLIEYEIFPSKPGIEGEKAALQALRDFDACL